MEMTASAIDEFPDGRRTIGRGGGQNAMGRYRGGLHYWMLDGDYLDGALEVGQKFPRTAGRIPGVIEIKGMFPLPRQPVFPGPGCRKLFHLDGSRIALSG
jgi:hypothetical protein